VGQGPGFPGSGAFAPPKKGELADRLEHLARVLAEAIPGKIADAPLRHVAVALGIVVDKMVLLRRLSAAEGGARPGPRGIAGCASQLA
jgi:hypothetical protein